MITKSRERERTCIGIPPLDGTSGDEPIDGVLPFPFVSLEMAIVTLGRSAFGPRLSRNDVNGFDGIEEVGFELLPGPCVKEMPSLSLWLGSTNVVAVNGVREYLVARYRNSMAQVNRPCGWRATMP